MHKALRYESIGENKVKCSLCGHRCVINEGHSGICGVRVNENGTLYASTYGKIAAEAIDPIEKKPLFHFLPGSDVYSLGGVGCNFRCTHCQNWQISQSNPDTCMLRELDPDEAVSRALDSSCQSIAWTYNEPTIWHEYAIDMGNIAREYGLGTIYVTNGYMTEEALLELSPMLNAFRVDLKAFSDDFYRKICGARLQPVLDSSVVARELGMHVETVTLIIPGLNDSLDEMKALISWVVENLGPDTPMHFTRFHPDYKMTEVEATPLKTLEKIYLMAKDLGINYPYLGNVMAHPFENTYCPECNSLLIERSGYNLRFRELDGDICMGCGEKIPVVRDVKEK